MTTKTVAAALSSLGAILPVGRGWAVALVCQPEPPVHEPQAAGHLPAVRPLPEGVARCSEMGEGRETTATRVPWQQALAETRPRLLQSPLATEPKCLQAALPLPKRAVAWEGQVDTLGTRGMRRLTGLYPEI